MVGNICLNCQQSEGGSIPLLLDRLLLCHAHASNAYLHVCWAYPSKCNQFIYFWHGLKYSCGAFSPCSALQTNRCILGKETFVLNKQVGFYFFLCCSAETVFISLHLCLEHYAQCFTSHSGRVQPHSEWSWCCESWSMRQEGWMSRKDTSLLVHHSPCFWKKKHLDVIYKSPSVFLAQYDVICTSFFLMSGK